MEWWTSGLMSDKRQNLLIIRYYYASNDIDIDLIVIIILLIILVRYTRQSWQYCQSYIEFLTEIFLIEKYISCQTDSNCMFKIFSNLSISSYKNKLAKKFSLS